ncbi:MAG: TIGR03619 family F420-dependent LLM class oxidoreductase [Dehalococcoidia bacterium]|nr:TIGR03619 family F420-dependent LLM class oxidoreductase [Dehalococcoidia bacterium]
MRYGVSLPQDPAGMDPVAVRDFAQAAEDLGYEFINGSDNLLDTDSGNVRHEPIIANTFMAACTSKVTLGTSVLILPERQTAVVAKQLAELDMLSSGRARLGIGLGSSEEEYRAVGMDMKTRGRRMEEQIHVLRAFWTQPVVTYKGRWHNIEGLGVNPLPPQRPIPIWVGGSSDAALKRIAKLADGWIPGGFSVEAVAPAIEQFNGYLKDAGRKPGDVAIQARLRILTGTPESWLQARDGYEAAGATHLGIIINAPEYTSIDQHIKQIRGFMEAAKA